MVKDSFSILSHQVNYLDVSGSLVTNADTAMYSAKAVLNTKYLKKVFAWVLFMKLFYYFLKKYITSASNNYYLKTEIKFHVNLWKLSETENT